MRPLLIRGGIAVAPLAAGTAVVDILVEGDTVRDVMPAGAVAPVPPDWEILDAGGMMVLPGLVNAHTHAHGALGKGCVPDCTNLETFLTLNPALVGGRSLEHKYLSAALSAVEMVKNGCTAAYDLFLELPLPTMDGMQRVAAAYADVGMRAVVAPMIADRTLQQALAASDEPAAHRHAGHAACVTLPECTELLAACKAILRDWSPVEDRVRVALGPTIPLHCSEALLAGAVGLAREFGAGIHTHLAESRLQTALSRTRFGTGLVAHLVDIGLLGERSAAAHCIWLDDGELARLADAGTAVVHNPLSNLRVGSGLAPVRRMLDSGATIALGTDACNTADSHNMFEAMRLSAYLSRPLEADPARWVSCAEAFTMATSGGARALGLDATIGRIAPGYKADLVFLDCGDILYTPLRDPLLQVVNGEAGRSVARVMVGGRTIYAGGRMLTIDEDKLRDAALEAVGQVGCQVAKPGGYRSAAARPVQ